MRIPTKTLASLLLMTAVAAAVPGIGSRAVRQKESQFDRILQRHDRKGELRASVLGVEPHVFRDMQKHMTFQEIAKRRGFRTIRAFRVALFGKLKNELRHRGWTSQRIERYMAARQSRVN